MATDANALLVPGTNFRLLEGAYVSGAPPAMPAASVAYGAAITGLDDLGYTNGGVALNLGVTTTDVVMDQDIDPSVILSTGRDIRLSTNLGEATGPRLKSAQGYGTVTTTASTMTVKGTTDWDLPGGAPALSDIATMVEAQARNGEALRILLYRAQKVSTGAMSIAKNAAALVPYAVRALPDTTVSPSRVLKFRQVLPLAAA